MKIVIIGAGLTGLSVAYHLEKMGFSDYEIFEKEERPGGLIKTEEKNGFLFDCAGHLLHLNKDYTKRLFNKFLREKFILHERKAGVFLKNRITDYPFQANLYNIPLDIVKECLIGFVKNRDTSHILYRNTNTSFSKKYGKCPYFLSFYDWILENFGDGFAKHFFVPYNTKLFKTDLRKLTCNWAKKFIPIPTLNEVINGAFKEQDKKYGYSSFFYYPKSGGISKLLDFFLMDIKKINLSNEVKRINLREKYIQTKNSQKAVKFDVIVSTIPIPELIKVLYPEDKKIITLADKLNYISVLNLNFGIYHPLVTSKHWLYFPEKDKVFYRVGFPSNVSGAVAPDGMSSISVEVSYTAGKYKINRDELIKKTKEQLVQIGFLKNKKNIIVELPLDIKYAYAVFDKTREKAIGEILDYLRKNNIFSIGRYGAWEYTSMEDSIWTGKLITDKIIGL